MQRKMFSIPCPNCGQLLRVPEQYLGIRGNCKKCNAFFVPARPTFLVAAIDVETTGLSAKQEEILEFGGVLFDLLSGDVIDTFSELTRPNRPIRERISDITGIYWRDVRAARSPEEVMRDFVEWAGQAKVLAAHNAPFDSKFLGHAMARYSMPETDLKIVDTRKWAKYVDLSPTDCCLATLLDNIGASTDGLHRALADAEGVRQLLMFFTEGADDPVQDTMERATDAIEKSRAAAEIKPFTWELDPVSERQLVYLAKLGADPSELNGLTKGNASSLIDQYLVDGASIFDDEEDDETETITLNLEDASILLEAHGQGRHTGLTDEQIQLV